METIKKFRPNWPQSVLSDLERALKAFCGPAVIEICKLPAVLIVKKLNPDEDIPTEDALCISGSLSIRNVMTRYKIPISVWLRNQYPLTPPFLTLAHPWLPQNVIIVKTHSHVDERGVIFLPYVHMWNSKTSNITDVLGEIVRIFDGNLPIKFVPHQAPPPMPPAASKSPNGLAADLDKKKEQEIRAAVSLITNRLQEAFWTNVAHLTMENERSLDWIDIFAEKDLTLCEMKEKDMANYNLAKAVALGIAIENHIAAMRDAYMANAFLPLPRYIANVRAFSRRQYYAYRLTKTLCAPLKNN